MLHNAVYIRTTAAEQTCSRRLHAPAQCIRQTRASMVVETDAKKRGPKRIATRSSPCSKDLSFDSYLLPGLCSVPAYCVQSSYAAQACTPPSAWVQPQPYHEFWPMQVLVVSTRCLNWCRHICLSVFTGVCLSQRADCSASPMLSSYDRGPATSTTIMLGTCPSTSSGAQALLASSYRVVGSREFSVVPRTPKSCKGPTGA